MRYPYSDVRFTWDEWRQYQKDLALADPALTAVAADHGMRLVISAKYPGRLLKKRRLAKLFLLNLTLDPETKRSQEPEYTLTSAYYRISLPFYLKFCGSRTLNKFSRAELQDSQRIKECLREAVSEMILRYGM